MQLGPLEAQVVGGEDAAASPRPLTVVLLHGYGAPGVVDALGRWLGYVAGGGGSGPPARA